MELSSGLTFPATEYLSHIIHTRALQGNEMLDSLCGHISVFPAVYLLVFPQCLHHGLWCWTALTSASSITQWSVSSGTCWGSSNSEKCIWSLPDCRYTLQSLKTFNPYWMSSYLFIIFCFPLPVSSSLLQPSILKVLLAADLEGFRHNHSVDEALQMESRNLLDD